MTRAVLGACVCLWTAQAVQAQAVDTDIYLADLTVRDGRLMLSGARNVTARAGYDNQPHFTLDGRAVLYTVIDTAGRADIWRYELAAGRVLQVTRTTPESEYSATPLRRGGFSVVRVESDSTQRLWHFRDDGSGARVVLENVRPVGYHAWVDDDVVALYVLGRPATLQVADARTGVASTHAADIGRSLQRVPGRRAVSFVQRASVGDTVSWSFQQLDIGTGTATMIAAAPTQSVNGRVATAEFHAWTPDGVLLTSVGSTIQAWDATAGAWYSVADFTAERLLVTRLAVSPGGERIAFVAQPMSQ